MARHPISGRESQTSGTVQVDGLSVSVVTYRDAELGWVCRAASDETLPELRDATGSGDTRAAALADYRRSERDRFRRAGK